MAQPDRNLVLHLGAKAAPPRRFRQQKALRTKIEQFIAYFNRTMAKPFRWTMEAKPLTG
ncbi:MAG: hypothetical protein M5U07_16015 [Xanthobacteraceae bacterium]|nr:hypothetical protein [Xanthobacteraceae bacterium]